MAIPTDIAGLMLWLDAGAGVYKDGAGTVPAANGDTVLYWADQHSTGNDATASSGPVLVTGAANGRSALRFNGSSNYFSLPNLMSGKTAGTIFWVVKCDNDPPGTDPPTGPPGGDFGTDANGDHYPYVDSNVYHDFGSNARKSCGNPATSLATWHVCTIISAGSDWRFYIGATLVFSTATNTVAWGTAPKIGQAGAAPYNFDGDLAEVVLYDTALSDTDRNAIRAYLDDRYFDVTAPALATATVPPSGTGVVLTITETGNPPLLPAGSGAMTGFTVKVNGAGQTTTATRVGPTTIGLSIALRISPTDTVTVSYVQASGNVTDSSSSLFELTAFTDAAVTNSSTYDAGTDYYVPYLPVGPSGVVPYAATGVGGEAEAFGDGAGSSTLTFAPAGAGSSQADAAAASTFTFAPAGTGSSLADAAAASTLTFSPTGVGSSLFDGAGASNLTFAPAGAADSLFDGAGASSLTFAPAATGESTADAVAASTLTFAPAATGASDADAAASSTLTFAPAGVGSALADAVAASTLAFAPDGIGSALADGAGSTTLTFGVTGSYADVVDGTGASFLTFALSAAGESFADFVATSSLTFSPAGVLDAVSDGAGDSDLSFALSSTADALADFAGASTLTFVVSGEGSGLLPSTYRTVYRNRWSRRRRVSHMAGAS